MSSLNGETKNIIRFCRVLSVEDGPGNEKTSFGGLRIKVRLTPEDGNIINDYDLQYAYPLLPKILHVNPKVGELVLVIGADPNAQHGQLFFIGPVISQPYFFDVSREETYAKSLFVGNHRIKPLQNPKNNPENDGTLPNRDDVALIGRKNSDVILKENEVRIRVGAKKNPDSANPLERLYFNDKDLGYIQMCFDKYTDPNTNSEFRSVINVVADRINLLSHDSGTYFNLGDKESLVTKDELTKILSNAHPLIFGDKFIEFMKQFLLIFKNHTHPMSMCKPVFTSWEDNQLSQNLENYLSKNIRIN